MWDLFCWTIGLLHFIFPISYFLFLKRYHTREWDITFKYNHFPKYTILLPTFNEKGWIVDRLNNLKAQQYSKDLMNLIIIDSSDDETPSLIKDWITQNNDLPVTLLQEKKRRGKLSALLHAFSTLSADSDVYVFTDADALWEPEALKKAAQYLGDPSVGSVTSSMFYLPSKDVMLEESYRDYFNFLRVAESKFYSTPVANGPFLAIKAKLLHKIGLPAFEGSDDSAFGSSIGFMGSRVLAADNIRVEEPIAENQWMRKIRRSQHLQKSFLTTKKYAKQQGYYTKTRFDQIWAIEWWLHLINPWILLVALLTSVSNLILFHSLWSAFLIALGLIPLILQQYRMYLLQQFILIISFIRNFYTKDVVWTK